MTCIKSDKHVTSLPTDPPIQVPVQLYICDDTMRDDAVTIWKMVILRDNNTLTTHGMLRVNMLRVYRMWQNSVISCCHRRLCKYENVNGDDNMTVITWWWCCDNARDDNNVAGRFTMREMMTLQPNVSSEASGHIRETSGHICGHTNKATLMCCSS